MTNCPNCGAPITGPVCEYCGTMHKSHYSGDASYICSLVEYGLITPNEARRRLGLDSLETKTEWIRRAAYITSR